MSWGSQVAPFNGAGGRSPGLHKRSRGGAPAKNGRNGAHRAGRPVGAAGPAPQRSPHEPSPLTTPMRIFAPPAPRGDGPPHLTADAAASPITSPVRCCCTVLRSAALA